jgi:hypothetical protein
VLGELSSLLRDTMILQVAPKAGLNLISGGFEPKTLGYFSKRMTTEELISALETIQKTLAGLREVKNPRTAAELCLVSLCSDAAGDSIDRLRARISRLEEQVERGVPLRHSAPVVVPSETEEPLPDEPVPEEPSEAWDAPEPLPPEPTAPEETAPSAPPAAPSDGELWPKIRSAVLPLVPMDARVSLEDTDRIRGLVEGNTLIIEPQNTFLVQRFQKQDVHQLLAQTAKTVAGRELRVLVRERQPEERQKRSLDELKQFKEVHFITDQR